MPERWLQPTSLQPSLDSPIVLLAVAIYILPQQEQDPKTCVWEFLANNEGMFFSSARHVISDFVMSSFMGWDSELLALCLSLFSCWCYYSHWRHFWWVHLKSFFSSNVSILSFTKQILYHLLDPTQVFPSHMSKPLPERVNCQILCSLVVRIREGFK